MVIRDNSTVNTCTAPRGAYILLMARPVLAGSHEEIICAYHFTERSSEFISALSAFAGNVVGYRGNDG